jgi:AcrR family transcriptional regulator
MAATEPARMRILEAAYDLFSRHGVRAVGIDRIVKEAGVAKMSLYRHFASKDDLVVAFLELREQRFTREWLEGEIERRGGTPRDRMLAVFDLFDEWFQASDFYGCSFIGTMLEVAGDGGKVERASVHHLNTIRMIFARLAEEAGLADPDNVAFQLQTLAMGSVVSARRGDLGAARRVRPMAEFVIDNG